jgi:hypothetical protein
MCQRYLRLTLHEFRHRLASIQLGTEPTEDAMSRYCRLFSELAELRPTQDPELDAEVSSAFLKNVQPYFLQQQLKASFPKSLTEASASLRALGARLRGEGQDLAAAIAAFSTSGSSHLLPPSFVVAGSHDWGVVSCDSVLAS